MSIHSVNSPQPSQKAVFVLQLLFCESNRFCGKRPFETLFANPFSPTITMFFRKDWSVKSSINIRFDVCVSILEEYDEIKSLLQKSTL